MVALPAPCFAGRAAKFTSIPEHTRTTRPRNYPWYKRPPKIPLAAVDGYLRTRSKLSGMAKNTAHLSVGRLLEVRAEAGYQTVADVDAIFTAIGHELAKLPSSAQQYITVVDWRCCPLMSPAAAEHMLKRIAGANALTLRSAALARDDTPTAVMQFVRLIREANLPDRKLFLNSEELQRWLAPVLTPPEQRQLRQFLG